MIPARALTIAIYFAFAFDALTSQNISQLEPSLECSHLLRMVVPASLNAVVHRTFTDLPCICQSPANAQWA
jgi:hypothetical protein